MAILLLFVFTAWVTASLATLTFVPRRISPSADRHVLKGRPILSPTWESESACTCIRAIELANSSIKPGSFAMLDAANKHARSMAVKRRLYQPPVRAINSRKGLPCGTFISGSTVGRARGTDPGATCSGLWKPRKGFRSLHVVIGSHRSSDGVMWCVALFGRRTKFEGTGACARVSCQRDVLKESANMRIVHLTLKKH